MISTMLDHALALAARGYEVFPLVGKIPAIRGGSGCLDASFDPQVVRSLWQGRREANIGIHVASTELVLDVDPRRSGDVDLRALELVNGALPRTRTSMTGRGDGGVHCYFRHPGGVVTTSRLPSGLDLKRRGGYVVAPPSVHPDTGGRYRWVDGHEPVALPPWFIELIRPVPFVAARPTFATASPGRRLEGLISFVLDSSEGERNNRLFWAACRCHELVQDGQGSDTLVLVALQVAGETVGLPAGEVHRTINSAFAPARL